MNNQVLKIIEQVVKEYGEQTQNIQLSKPTSETALFGKNAVIDSIGFVTVIVSTEQRIEEKLGRSITLADERAMSQKNSPFLTIGTLSNYIANLINGK